MPLHPNVERVQAALRQCGLDARVVKLADSARTSAEAAGAIGTSIAQIAKSLVFEAVIPAPAAPGLDDDEAAAGNGDVAQPRPILVIASGASRVSMRKLGALVGSKTKRASADMVRQATGFPIGGVAPLAHPAPLPIYIDQDLLRFDEVWAAAGTPHAVFAIAPQDLVSATGGTLADLREEDVV